MVARCNAVEVRCNPVLAGKAKPDSSEEKAGVGEEAHLDKESNDIGGDKYPGDVPR